MLDLAITGFALAFLLAGFRRPFLWVLAYIYIDTLSPQHISYYLLASVPISLITFGLAFLGWAFTDNLKNSRFTLRQWLLVALLIYCGLSTIQADFFESALTKWNWVWKALVFAIFLPLTLHTRLRIEAAVLVMILTAGAIIIEGGLKTVAGGGGYGTLRLFLDDNSGLYEGSTLSMVAIALIPLIFWIARHGTIFPPEWKVRLFALALIFACLLIPIGTQTRTGILCIGLLAFLSLRTAKHRFFYLAIIALIAVASVPFLPESYVERMSTIQNHKSSQSASTRVAVWLWTLDYVKQHPLGGGFNMYLGNTLKLELEDTKRNGGSVVTTIRETEDKARAFHSAYFEMLGEQGWPGLILWLTMLLLGLGQMEWIRARWLKRTGPEHEWQAPLANALQQSLCVYLLGAMFVGVAFQPFCYMLVGLQCGLWSYVRRIDSPRRKPGLRAAPLRWPGPA